MELDVMMRMVCQAFAKSPAPINKGRHTYAANEHMPARPLPHAHMGATRFFPFFFFFKLIDNHQTRIQAIIILVPLTLNGVSFFQVSIQLQRSNPKPWRQRQPPARYLKSFPRKPPIAPDFELITPVQLKIIKTLGLLE